MFLFTIHTTYLVSISIGVLCACIFVILYWRSKEGRKNSTGKATKNSSNDMKAGSDNSSAAGNPDSKKQLPAEEIDWENKYNEVEKERKQLQDDLAALREKMEALENSRAGESPSSQPGISAAAADVHNLRSGQTVDNYFYSEVMVTAGPRKSNKKDIDLGEDTCGVVHAADKILFWLLDGASDQESQFFWSESNQAKFEMFSSRLMVQSISRALPKVFMENQDLDAKSLARHAIQKFSDEWVEFYSKIKDVIKERRTLKCEATLIVGILDKHGKMDAYTIGDSRLLMFDGENKFINSTPDTDSNQIFMAEVDKEGKLKLYTGKDANGAKEQGGIWEGHHIQASNVNSIICHSDGISRQRSRKIQEKSKEGFISIRKALNRLPVNTEDDKSMLIVELKNS